MFSEHCPVRKAPKLIFENFWKIAKKKTIFGKVSEFFFAFNFIEIVPQVLLSETVAGVFYKKASLKI